MSTSVDHTRTLPVTLIFRDARHDRIARAYSYRSRSAPSKRASRHGLNPQIGTPRKIGLPFDGHMQITDFQRFRHGLMLLRFKFSDLVCKCHAWPIAAISFTLLRH